MRCRSYHWERERETLYPLERTTLQYPCSVPFASERLPLRRTEPSVFLLEEAQFRISPLFLVSQAEDSSIRSELFSSPAVRFVFFIAYFQDILLEGKCPYWMQLTQLFINLFILGPDLPCLDESLYQGRGPSLSSSSSIPFSQEEEKPLLSFPHCACTFVSRLLVCLVCPWGQSALFIKSSVTLNTAESLAHYKQNQ